MRKKPVPPKPTPPKRGRGQPTAYQPTYAKQAEKLCQFGATDEDLADFFGVGLAEIAIWAWDNEEFFNAITPDEKTKERWKVEKTARREKINAARRRRLHASPARRVENAMRARIWAALKGNSDGALFERLGFSREDLMAHLESRFQSGMTWGNYGAWHVDHIRPCISFDQTQPAEFEECWNLNNLQPLWGAENIRKGAIYGRA